MAKGTTRLKEAERIVQTQVEQIDDEITKLEKYLRPYEKIKAEIDKLRSARRALLGGSKQTGAGSTKLRQQDIVEFLEQNPGASPGQIAEAHGVTQSTVSSHLYRGKGERFLTKDQRWWNRDPKNGINTADDIEE